MDFLRRHVFQIACAVAAAAGVALAVTGIGAMPKVGKEMEAAKNLYDALGRLENQAANGPMIEAESERIDILLADCGKILSKASQLYGYEPLVQGVFPNGDTVARFEYLKAYQDAMNDLMESLRYGNPPTNSEIDAMRERIEIEKYREREIGIDPGAAPSVSTSTGEKFTPAGVVTPAGAKRDAETRAAIAKAQSIYCYAKHYNDRVSREATASLFYHPFLRDTGTLEPPLLEDIWWSQIQYWIQKDVVDAIVAVNEEAAAAAKARDEDRWVGIMPVKEVISIRLSEGYIDDDESEYSGPSPDGYTEALPCATRTTVFTESMSGPSYDVIQFTVKLIMDQRDILRLVDRISKNKPHALLRVAYKAVKANRRMRGKIYGSDPTVNIVLDFETIMLPGVFHPLMPQAVCDEYEHITCPQRDSGEQEGE